MFRILWSNGLLHGVDTLSGRVHPTDNIVPYPN
eukprot:COSAG05_NODE_7143_length_851_cov_1.053191_1_plen_32_part_01